MITPLTPDEAEQLVTAIENYIVAIVDDMTGKPPPPEDRPAARSDLLNMLLQVLAG
jgi:hypothetical protein